MKLKVNSVLYYFGYLFWILMRLISLTNFSTEFNILQVLIKFSPYFAILCFLLKMILDARIQKRLLFCIILIFPVILIAGIASDNIINLLCAFIAIVASKNINIKKIIYMQMVIMAIILLFTVTSSKYGIIQNFVSKSQYSGRIRNYLGFNYATFAPNLFFHLTSLIIFFKGKSFNVLYYGFLAGVNYFLYIQTDTKSAFYITNLMLILLYVSQVFQLEKHYSNKIFLNSEKYLVGIMSILSIFASIFYSPENKILYNIDKIVTNRLRLANFGIETYGITLFGQKINWITLDESKLIRNDYFFVDSSFVNILLSYGLVLLLLLVIGFYYLGKNNPYGSIYYHICFFGIVIHSTWDPQFLEIWYNPLLLMLSIPIFGDTNILKKGKQ